MIVKILLLLCAFGAIFAEENDKNKFKIPPKKLLPEGKMPVVGYGTFLSDGDNLERALNTAFETGYRHIDTATLYQNEKIIGKVIKEWIETGKLKREDLFIVTKLPPEGNRPEGVKKYLEKSLNELGLDYVDLYLIHAPIGVQDSDDVSLGAPKVLDVTTDILAVWKAMEDQVALGKTKAIGLSNFNQSQIERILKTAKIPPANLQIELHAYMQQKSLTEFCKKQDITVTAYSPLGNPGLDALFKKLGKNETVPKLMENPVVKELAEKHKKSPAQILLRHAIQKGLIVIPKSLNDKRIAENINIHDFELNQEDMKKMNSLDKGDVARLVDYTVYTGAKTHPEYPF